MTSEKYDSTFLGILQQEGNIGSFLDTVMGFLYRRTDFYHLMKSKEDKLGFPPGVAPRLLIQAFEKYEALARKRDNSLDTRTVIPSRPDQSEIMNKTAAELTKKNEPKAAKQDPSQTTTESADTKSTESESRSAAAEVKDSGDSQQKFQDNPESHNGAIRDGYRWAQTITDCDLRVQVPDYILKAKQVKVVISKKHISISHTDSGGQNLSLVDSDLAWPINVEESMWSLVPKDCIHINMEKVQERWWEHVFVEEPRINTQKIEATMPMEHLDDGAKATVDKLVYDEHQKKLGLPTSKEQAMQETLRKAWDADGSPFAGTPFDPNSVNLSTGSSSS